MSARDVEVLLNEALECSIYLDPKEPGLTHDELKEVGRRAGFQEGEIEDAIAKVAHHDSGVFTKKLHLNPMVSSLLGTLSIQKNPEYRNKDAFDFVYSQLNSIVRAGGARNAQIERRVLVERAVARKLPERDVEAAITIMVMCHHLVEKENQLRPPPGWNYEHLPSQQHAVMNAQHNPVRERAYRFANDVIERRSDGRPKHAEPLDAFLEALERLGYGRFRLWWSQMVAELRQSNPQSSPVSVLVLSAALVEGSLTFVVKHARNLGLGVFQSSDFAGEPRTWKIEALVNSAARGRDSAILDDQTRMRADKIIKTRQRIHAGRLLSDFTQGTVDLRPEEVREARAVAEEVVRRVLDWLEKYPASAAPPPSN